MNKSHCFFIGNVCFMTIFIGGKNDSIGSVENIWCHPDLASGPVLEVRETSARQDWHIPFNSWKLLIRSFFFSYSCCLWVCSDYLECHADFVLYFENHYHVIWCTFVLFIFIGSHLSSSDVMLCVIPILWFLFYLLLMEVWEAGSLRCHHINFAVIIAL